MILRPCSMASPFMAQPRRGGSLAAAARHFVLFPLSQFGVRLPKFIGSPSGLKSLLLLEDGGRALTEGNAFIILDGPA